MKVVYTGVHKALAPKFQGKLDAKFAKLAKLLDGRGEREAHVIVTQERHMFRAEITVNCFDHTLVTNGSDADLFTAVHQALEKLEQQAVKLRSKWREKTRRESPRVAEKVAQEPTEKTKEKGGKEKSQSAPAKVERVASKRVFRVNHRGDRKPITLDEAVIEMEKDRDYLVYRDTENGSLSVLVRRRDGHFDLIES